MKDSQDYRIFVGAFPAGELARQIQAVREHYDLKTAQITAPHVTVAGTYWRSGAATAQNEAGTIAAVHEALAQAQPFALELGGIFTFPPENKPVIYLGVEPTAGLLAARRALLKVLGPEKHHGFAPHLTLAMRLGAPEAQGVIAELQASRWNRQRWSAPIEVLYLMQRGPADPAWRAIASFPLAG